MSAAPPVSLANKLLIAIDLHETGVMMMRQNLRRRRPDASEGEIDELLKAWLHERPGAAHGDADGHPVPWPRTGR